VVASIKSRDSLLCALFSYLAIYIWLYNYQKPNILKTTFIAILFLAGLLSKEEGLPLIMIVFLVSYVFLNLNTFNSLKQTLPFLFAAFFYLLIRTIILDPSPEGYNSIVNNIIFGTSGKTRLATNLYIYLYYIKLLFFPFSLSWDYSYNQIPIKTMANGWVLLSLCFFSALIIIALKGLRKREILSFGILFYLTTFSIFSNFTENITIGSTIGERFMFIPSLGFSIVLVYGLYIVLSKLAIKKKLLYIVSLIFPIILIFSTLSYSRTNVWRDNLALGRSGIKSAPKSWRTHVIYADELRIQANKMIYDTLGNYSLNDTAKGIFKEAILNYESGYLIIADKVKQFPYLQGLGECYLQIGDTVSAKKIYLKAAENPKLFLPLYKLGMISFDEKQYSNSIKFWQRSLAAESPDSFSTYKNIGASWLMLKEYEKSIEAYQKALKFKTSPDILSNMAFLYAAAGDYENANKFRPKDGNISNEEMSFHNYMASGRAAYETGNFGKAIDFFKKCDPGFTKFGGHSKFPDFLNTFARCYLMLNDISHSKATFKRVIQVDPRNYFALMNLGIISSRYEKNYNEAEGYFSSCLQSNSPDYLLTYENLGTTYWQLNQIDRAIENYENALKFGTSTTIVNYLIELWKYKGNSEKVTYYQLLKSKTP
jgi:tetratricopeptide (TPR) repeat protein